MSPREIPPVLVLADPHPADTSLRALGWMAGAEPIARSWVRPGGFPALLEHHDPVTDLRWLEVQDVHPEGRAEIAASVRTIPSPDLLAWLAHADPAVRLRGIQAAGLAEARSLSSRLALLQLDPSPLVVRAAGEQLRRWQAEDEARPKALLAMAALANLARPVVAQLARGELTGVLPEPGDAALVFAPAVAPGAAEAYVRFWEEQKGRVRPVGDRGEPDIYAVTAGMMHKDGPWMQPLAQGMRGVAGALRPEVAWLSWRWAGSSGDGLVFVGDRWRWYPKPYRVLKTLLQRLWGDT
jgi:hypothetical protein